MGDKTYTQFQEQLVFDLGQRTDLDSWKGTWVNTAYKTLTNKHRFPQLRTKFIFPELEVSETTATVTDTAYISTPSDALVIRTLWDATSDAKLTKVAWGDYVKATGRANVDSSGTPTQWCRRGSRIYLLPTPDAVYSITVYYRKRIAAMTASAEKTVIGAEWDEAIQQLAKIQSLIRLGEYDDNRLALEKGVYDALIQDIIGIYHDEERDRKDIRKPLISWLRPGKR